MPDASKTLVQAFISGRLDYCNSLLYGMTDCLFQHLQSVQNAAVRLNTWTGQREHIRPVLRELHWLPVWSRVDFKLATFMYKTLHGRIPRYLSDDCQLISDASRWLRSSNGPTCLHLPCHGPELVWVTDHLLLPDHRYWTVCQQICA